MGRRPAPTESLGFTSETAYKRPKQQNNDGSASSSEEEEDAALFNQVPAAVEKTEKEEPAADVKSELEVK